MSPTQRPLQAFTPKARESRRQFIQGSGLMLAGGTMLAGSLDVARAAHPFGSGRIKLGLIGCGVRGTAAAMQALGTSGGDVELVAMADLFEDRLNASHRAIKSRFADQVGLRGGRFHGLDGYRGVLASDADVVMLATPPGFRPLQFEAAVAAGKHVFMEKPLATDAPGVRRVLAANQAAMEKGLAVSVGFQRRHEPRYQQCVEKLHDGAIGEFVFARAYWNANGTKPAPRSPGQTELEYQIRHWKSFPWIGGDLLTEQHVQNLDVMNWVMQSTPKLAQGQGGRWAEHDGRAARGTAVSPETRDGEADRFDHHMVEFVYDQSDAGEVHLISQCRQARGRWNRVGEFVHGTLGTCDLSDGVIRDRRGNVLWQSDATDRAGKGWQRAQQDLFDALRKGQPMNEVPQAAASTMTAIMGRIASATGKLVKWEDVMSGTTSGADIDRIVSLDCPAPV